VHDNIGFCFKKLNIFNCEFLGGHVYIHGQ
jgi:hypothetical protein